MSRIWLALLLLWGSARGANLMEFSAQGVMDPEGLAPKNSQVLEVLYARRLGQTWVAFFGSRYSGERGDLIPLSSRERGQTNILVQGLGLGLLYESHFLRELFGAQKVFETSAAMVGHYGASADHPGGDYAGFGTKAEFGVHYKPWASASYGFKLSYHLLPLAPPKPSSEGASVSFLGAGVAITLFF